MPRTGWGLRLRGVPLPFGLGLGRELPVGRIHDNHIEVCFQTFEGCELKHIAMDHLGERSMIGQCHVQVWNEVGVLLDTDDPHKDVRRFSLDSFEERGSQCASTCTKVEYLQCPGARQLDVRNHLFGEAGRSEILPSARLHAVESLTSNRLRDFQHGHDANLPRATDRVASVDREEILCRPRRRPPPT